MDCLYNTSCCCWSAGRARTPCHETLCSPALEHVRGYLTKLLQNHTAYACDGQHLSLHCPRHSTISVQSAFYGQDPHVCSAWEPETRMTEPRNCVAPTSLQKVLDECQNLRSCQLLVNSRVFGPDLCPGTTKFLLVSFKCKPTEYKTKSACENQELKLHCQESKFLIIYSATYGRWAHEESVCSTKAEHTPPFDCLSYTALEVLSKRCYGKQRCKIIVTSQDFGSPCLPGVTKYLNVSYACVPKFILTAVNPLVPDNKSSIKQNDGVDLDPRESRLPKKDGTIVSSNYLATFAYLRVTSRNCTGRRISWCQRVPEPTGAVNRRRRRRGRIPPFQTPRMRQTDFTDLLTQVITQQRQQNWPKGLSAGSRSYRKSG
ncbi:protein eva-1 homolog C isoform X3 [Onychostruthus taczanowskii]|uniref:protein eva-1 homolog C isoform X3 n=1 Tax=Onychostruthus taczanowskii TaxID=356909 RepID=UPI001B8062FE|nr:protein eva-1 homolog C isoform X3 [Onychostruthus taczanowskii]